MKSGDAAQIDSGVQQVRAWLDGHQVVWRQWSDWNDYLMKVHRFQDVAEMALSAVNSRPEQRMIARQRLGIGHVQGGSVNRLPR